MSTYDKHENEIIRQHILKLSKNNDLKNGRGLYVPLDLKQIDEKNKLYCMKKKKWCRDLPNDVAMELLEQFINLYIDDCHTNDIRHTAVFENAKMDCMLSDLEDSISEEYVLSVNNKQELRILLTKSIANYIEINKQKNNYSLQQKDDDKCLFELKYNNREILQINSDNHSSVMLSSSELKKDIFKLMNLDSLNKQNTLLSNDLYFSSIQHILDLVNQETNMICYINSLSEDNICDIIFHMLYIHQVPYYYSDEKWDKMDIFFYKEQVYNELSIPELIDILHKLIPCSADIVTEYQSANQNEITRAKNFIKGVIEESVRDKKIYKNNLNQSCDKIFISKFIPFTEEQTERVKQLAKKELQHRVAFFGSQKYDMHRYDIVRYLVFNSGTINHADDPILKQFKFQQIKNMNRCDQITIYKDVINNKMSRIDLSLVWNDLLKNDDC